MCDGPASDCTVWDSHCKASHDDRRWRDERERFKRLGRGAALAPSQPAAAPAALARQGQSNSSGARSSSSSTSSTTNGRPAEYSVRKLLEKITTVHPIEIAPPAGSGFVTSLKHYQKQSLAFMVDLERGSDDARKNRDCNESVEPTRGGLLADQVGMGKSAVVIALVATNPAGGLATEQEIRAHVENVNANEQNRASAVKAFHEERRRGRSALFESLGLDDKHDYHRCHPVVDVYDNKKSRELGILLSSLSEKHRVDRIKLKTTVILTSVSLMGQW